MYILSPNYSRFHFFFSPPAAGLTNRGPVRDSDPGAPLVWPLICLAYVTLPFLGVPPTYPSVGTMSAIGGSDTS